MRWITCAGRLGWHGAPSGCEGAGRGAGAAGSASVAGAPMNKNYRHGQILKLIRSKRIHTQDELAKALRSIGVPATQVTLSRDIRELGLVKTAEGYIEGVAEPAGDGFGGGGLAREFVPGRRLAAELLVLRAQAG